MNNANKIALVMVMASILTGCATKTDERLCSDEILSKERSIKVVAIMPPSFRIMRSAVKGDSELFEMNEDVANIALHAAEAALEKFEFEVVGHGITDEVLSEYPDIKFDLTNLNDKFDKIQIQTETDFLTEVVTITDTRIRKGELSIGYDVAPFAEDAGADGLLFIHGVGYIHSAGKQALGAAAALGGVQIIYYDVLYYRAFLVDGKDGTVHAAFFGGAGLDQFIYKKAIDEKEKYQTGMKKLKSDLERSFSNSLSETLKNPQ